MSQKNIVGNFLDRMLLLHPSKVLLVLAFDTNVRVIAQISPLHGEGRVR